MTEVARGLLEDEKVLWCEYETLRHKKEGSFDTPPFDL